MKLAFVVQRCGNEVIGGSEKVCLEVAKRLSDLYEIEIITTCALDHISWENYYPEGIAKIDNVIIRRFKTDATRDIQKFVSFCQNMLSHKRSIAEEDEWMRLQGPLSSSLIQFIKVNQDHYDLFIFFTYLYLPTYYGLKILLAKKSILVPFAHDEDWLYLSIFKEMFKNAGYIIYHTEEEKKLVNKTFDVKNTPSKIIGYGLEELFPLPPNFTFRMNIDFPYIFYLGRIESLKGIEELIDFVITFKQNNQSDLKLILGGKVGTNTIKSHNDIIVIDSLDEHEKRYLIEKSLIFVNPSPHESFSIATMEAWLAKKPVLVNAKSEVLKGHCEKSNGGLYYENYPEFERCLKLLLHNEDIRMKLGENGEKYVKINYSWDTIKTKYKEFIDYCYTKSHRS